MLRKMLLLFVLKWFAAPVIPQSFDYYFNNCDLNEKEMQSNSMSASSAVLCECGIEGDAVILNNQTLQMPLGFDTLFFEDWTIGFSIQIDRKDRNLDILSKMHSCNADTNMYFIYRAADSMLVCHFQENISEFVELNAKMVFNTCWQQIVVTKNLGTFRIFVNGQLKDQKLSRDLIRLNNKAPIRFNGSPCTVNLFKTEGLLDKLFIRKGSVNAGEVLLELVQQDAILTQDTLIFLGDNVLLRSISSCANAINWTPAGSLDNASIENPVASPVAETLYRVRFSKRNCSTIDSVLVRVVDPNQINCDKLLLPTAFTPNQDGLNEVFGISNDYIFDKLEYFDVFDRNGAIVFSTDKSNEQWDGTFNQKPLSPGKYFYRIAYSCKNENYTKQGAVFLMR